MRPQRMPKLETTGPSTGQMNRRRAVANRASGQRRRAGSPQQHRQFGLDRGNVAIQVLFGCSIFSSAATRLARVATRADWRCCTAERALASARSSAAIASRADSIRVLGRAQTGNGPLHLVAQVAHAADYGFVHAVDPVEVFGAIDEVVVAVGADDDAEHVRGSGLIDRDEAIPQGHESPLEMGPHHRQSLLGDVELGFGPVQFRLLGVEPDADRRLGLRSAATSPVSRSIRSP